MAKVERHRYAVSMVWPNGIKTVNLFHHEDNARKYIADVLIVYPLNHVYMGEIVAQTEIIDD
jgi:hypothetical protein